MQASSNFSSPMRRLHLVPSSMTILHLQKSLALTMEEYLWFHFFRSSNLSTFYHRCLSIRTKAAQSRSFTLLIRGLCSLKKMEAVICSQCQKMGLFVWQTSTQKKSFLNSMQKAQINSKRALNAELINFYKKSTKIWGSREDIVYLNTLVQKISSNLSAFVPLKFSMKKLFQT